MAALENILSISPNRGRIEDASRLYIVFLFATVLFPQTNGLCSGMLCDMVENLTDIGRFNWAQAIHSFLVYYMGLTAVYACTRASGGQARGGNLCGAAWILQVWLFEHTNMWVGKPHITGGARFNRWLGRIKLSKLYGGRPNGSLSKKEYEELIGTINDSNIRLTIGGPSEVLDEDVTRGAVDRCSITTLMGKVERVKVRMKMLEEKYAHLQGQHQDLQEKFHACEHEYGKLVKSLVRRIEALEQNKGGAKILRNEADEEPDSGEEEGNKGSMLSEGGHGEEPAEVEKSSDQHTSSSDEEVDKQVEEADMDVMDVTEHDVQPTGDMVDKDREHPLLSFAQAAEDVNIVVEEHVDHEEADDDFVSPPPRYSRRLRKKGPLLQSPFTQQSSSLAEPSSLVELGSSALPSVATEDMDDINVYYTDLNKIVKLDRETNVQFVAKKGSLP